MNITGLGLSGATNRPATDEFAFHADFACVLTAAGRVHGVAKAGVEDLVIREIALAPSYEQAAR